VFVALSAPFLAVQYFGPDKVQNAHPANRYVSDLLNFVVPPGARCCTGGGPARQFPFHRQRVRARRLHRRPLVLFAVVAVVLARHRRVTWVALAVAAGAALLSLGPTLHVRGSITHMYLPDFVLEKLPLLHNLLPDRFASMTGLGVGLLVALGLDELKHLRRPAQAGGWALAGPGWWPSSPPPLRRLCQPPFLRVLLRLLLPSATGTSPAHPHGVPGHPQVVPGHPPVAFLLPS